MSQTPHDFPDDRNNPYAPPLAEIGRRPHEQGPGNAIPFTIGDILTFSWELYKRRMGICIGATAAWFGMLLVFSIGVNIVTGALSASGRQGLGVAFQLGMTVVNLFYQNWLTAGLLTIMLRVVRGQEVEIGALFNNGRFVLKLVGATLLWTLAILGITVVCLLPGGIAVGVTGGMGTVPILLLVLGGIIALVGIILLGIRVSQFAMLIIDRNAGVIESFSLSSDLTRGREGTIFVLYAFSFALYIGGLLACLVGLIFTIPFMMVIFAVTYVAIVGQPVGPTSGIEGIRPGPKPLADPDFDGIH